MSEDINNQIEERPILVLMVGPSAAGKSTLAKQICEGGTKFKLLSSDSLRAVFGKNESDQTVNGKVFGHIKSRTNIFLENKDNVIIDATNITVKDRKDFIEIGKLHNANIKAFVIKADKKTLFERNNKRSRAGGRKVPEDVIEKMISKFQEPTKEEGFEEINIIG